MKNSGRKWELTIKQAQANENQLFPQPINKQNTGIQFTKEIKENGKFPFLDC